MKSPQLSTIMLAVMFLSLPACRMHTDHAHEEHGKIVLTSPMTKDMVFSEQYVCQIHARRTIEVRSLERGYLEGIRVKEGQTVKKGDVMFRIVPVLYKAKLDADMAEAEFARLELANAEALLKQKVVSPQEVALYRAKLAKAEAKVKLAQAELDFTFIKAPFDGIVDRLHYFLGSLVEEGEILTTLSDNKVMWVYFNVPEARYLEFMADKEKVQAVDYESNKKRDSEDGDDDVAEKEQRQLELVLANGRKFPETGKIAAIEAKFNNETGNIPFRADFPNPTGLLRHGQTGNVLIHRTLKNALVIPQRATFEILDKMYVYVVGEDGVVHQRWITVQHELDDIFVIESGLEVHEKIVLDGVRQVHDGEKVEFEYRAPEQVLDKQKHHAE
ncbi:MAG: efflux RND transporter periplasmic adaptor subunit [Gemmataceae bacterium]